MLDGMRKNARSWGIKALFAIIIIVFVFWGVGGFRANQKNVIAKVNGKPILATEFLKTYQSEYEKILRQRPNLSSEDLQRLGLKKMVFDQLVLQTVLLQKADELGIVVSDEDIKDEITSMDVFKNENKVFDANRYQAILSSNNLTPAEFEDLVKRDLRIRKLRDLITSAVQATDDEARDLYNFIMKKGKIEYIIFKVEDFEKKVNITDEEIKKYYEEHKNEFKEPQKIQIQYIKLTPEVLAPEMEVSDKDIEDYYNKNKSMFFEGEQRKVRHILIKIENKEQKALKEAQHILEKIKKGEDFTTLAQKYSQGPSAKDGGDIGWIKRGETVKEFEDVAFSLKKGEVGGPVKTIFGYHIIKVEDIKKEHYRKLDEVKDEIKDIIAKQKAQERLDEFLDKAIDSVFSNNKLEEAANKLNVPLLTSNLITKEQLITTFGIKEEEADELFLMENNKLFDNPMIIQDGYIIAKKIQDIPARIKKIEEVKDDIMSLLKSEKAKDMAEKEAKKELLQVKENKVRGLDIKISEEFQFSSGQIPELGFNRRLSNDLMTAKKGNWLSDVYDFGDKLVIVRVSDMKLPEGDQWEKQKSFWKEMVLQRKKQTLFNEFLLGLRNSAEIEVLNPEILKG